MVRITQRTPSLRVCDAGVIVQRPECCCNQGIGGSQFRFDPLLILLSALVYVLNAAILSVVCPSTNSSSSCLAGRALSYGPVFILKALERLVDFYSVSQQQL